MSGDDEEVGRPWPAARVAKVVGPLAAWGGLILLATRASAFTGELGTAPLCGPWGCTAVLEDVVAIHTTFLAVVLPPAIWATIALPRRFAWRVPLVVTTVGAVLTGGLFLRGVREAADLAARMPADFAESHPDLWLEVGVFTLLNESTVPAAELLAAGVLAGVVYFVFRYYSPSGDAKGRA